VQNNGIIISGLSEALISGDEIMPFMFWTNPAGWVVIATGILTLMLVIVVIGLCFKIRLITMSLLLLERTAAAQAAMVGPDLPVKAPDLVFDYFDEKHLLGKRNMTARLDIDKLIRQVSQDNWVYILLTLFFVVIGWFIIRRIYKRICRRGGESQGFELLLEIASLETTEYVVIGRYPGQVSQYRAFVSSQMGGVTLAGIW